MHLHWGMYKDGYSIKSNCKDSGKPYVHMDSCTSKLRTTMILTTCIYMLQFPVFIYTYVQYMPEQYVYIIDRVTTLVLEVAALLIVTAEKRRMK